MTDDELLYKLHHVLLEVHNLLSITWRVSHNMQMHIVEGVMICPNCKHAYPISNGIPNMVGCHAARFSLASIAFYSF